MISPRLIQTVASLAMLLAMAVAAEAVAQTRVPGVPEEADGDDPGVRLLLLAPSGPVVVDLDITIEGEPFRRHRETLVAQSLASADADGDGKATWKETLADPTFVAGRYAYLGRTSEPQYSRLMKQYDFDGDDFASKAELRNMLARAYGGPALTLLDRRYLNGYAAFGAGLEKLVNVDGDDVLDADELAQAAKRLHAADLNDDQMLDGSELMMMPSPTRGGASRTTDNGIAFEIRPDVDFDAIAKALVEKYGDDQQTLSQLPALRRWGDELDADQDGQIVAAELQRFWRAPADAKLTIDLAPAERSHLKVDRDSKYARLRSQPSGGRANLSLSSCSLKVAVGGPYPSSYANADAAANSYLAAYDGDKNGYITLEELKKANGAKGQFAIWDADSDGKVYPDELKAAFKRSRAPTMQRVSIGVVSDDGALSAVVDENGDYRLSLREMRNAVAKLKQLDHDGDGKVTAGERHSSIRLAIAQSNGIPLLLSPQAAALAAQRSENTEGPRWFRHMDSNGDGDISPREFLGDARQFEGIDKDGDGLIDASEAAAAEAAR